MSLEINNIKTIILDKIQGKSESQIKLDLLQNEIIKDKDIIGSMNENDIITYVKEAVDQLVKEGKLIIDVTGDIIDR